MARLKPCIKPGCHTLVKLGKRFCTEHARHNNEHRQLGTYRYKKLRKYVFERDRAICQLCNKRGMITPASECDHIQPVSQGGDEFDPDNMQALCRPCHAAKTRLERIGT